MRYCLSYDYDNTADEDNEAEENSLIATVKPTDYTKNIPDEEVMSLIEDIEENEFVDLDREREREREISWVERVS